MILLLSGALIIGKRDEGEAKRCERNNVCHCQRRSLGKQFMMGMADASSNILHFICLYFNRMRDQHTGSLSIYEIRGNKVNQGAWLL